MPEFDPEAHSKLRRKVIGSATYSEFGRLHSVDSEPQWLNLTSEIGHRISMKKVYYGWGRVYQWAERLIGQHIVYETGNSSSASEYFRDIYPDTDGDNPFEPDKIFAKVPGDAGDAAKDLIFKQRLALSNYRFRLQWAREDYEAMQIQLEQMTQAEKKEAEVAADDLDADWDQWVTTPKRYLLVAGQAMNPTAKHPKKIDISFAMRMGIDVTERKRIEVDVKSKIKDSNKIRCTLPQFGDQECVIAVKRSTVNNTKGQWACATVENTLSGWWKVESQREYVDAKNRRQPIQYFLDLHDKIFWKVLGL